MACAPGNNGLIVCADNLPHSPANQDTLTNLLNISFVIFGALAFLFIVIAGFRLVTSRGEPAKVADIRRQIIFAALGLIVIASAAAIVNFVLGKVG